MKKVMLVASAGGHWVQLNRLNTAFERMERIYITTEKRYRLDLKGNRILIVPDANRRTWFRIFWLTAVMLKNVIMIKPDVVVSTGAAPGLLAIILAKAIGAKTIWVDSIANVDSLSMSGKIAGRFADLWLTQWEHLATPVGPFFKGSVI